MAWYTWVILGMTIHYFCGIAALLWQHRWETQWCARGPGIVGWSLGRILVLFNTWPLTFLCAALEILRLCVVIPIYIVDREMRQAGKESRMLLWVREVMF